MKSFSLYSRYVILLLFLNSCAPLLEKIDMSSKNLSCVKKEGKNRYSAFDIEFSKKSDTISLIPNKSHCSKDQGVGTFVGMFKVNIVDKNQANYKIGNSAFFQLTILDFKDIEKKYKTNQELKKLVKASINKRVLEMKNSN